MSNLLLLDEVCAVLNATQGECDGDALREAERHIRRVLGKRLCYGAAIEPTPTWESKAEAIHTVMTIKRHNEACTATSVVVTVFTGGALSSSPCDRAGNIQFLYTGGGKAFKFIRHDTERQTFTADDFCADSFPYKPHEFACTQSECGTLALVKGDAKATFVTDSVCMVSAGRIDDLRLYTDRAKLVYDLVTLFEEIISFDDRGMRDRIFRALL